jgi:hypothetical protein
VRAEGPAVLPLLRHHAAARPVRDRRPGHLRGQALDASSRRTTRPWSPGSTAMSAACSTCSRSWHRREHARHVRRRQRLLVRPQSEIGRLFDQTMGGNGCAASSAPVRGRPAPGGPRRWPGTVPAGRVSDEPWAFWDFLPTAAELAGATLPGGSFKTGRPLAGLVPQGRPGPQARVFLLGAARGQVDPGRALRRLEGRPQRPFRPIELYDLARPRSGTRRFRVPAETRRADPTQARGSRRLRGFAARRLGAGRTASGRGPAGLRVRGANGRAVWRRHICQRCCICCCCSNGGPPKRWPVRGRSSVRPPRGARTSTPRRWNRSPPRSRSGSRPPRRPLLPASSRNSASPRWPRCSSATSTAGC